MLRKSFVWLLLPVFIFSGCGSKPVSQSEPQKVEKKEFYVTTKKIGDFGNEVNIKKTGRMVGSQDVLITALASGKVVNINVKEGDNVNQGDMLITLSDSISSYQQSLMSAQNALDSAKLTYENNKISLEKNIGDARLALDKAQNDYNQALKDSQISLDKAQKDYSIAQKDVEESLKKAQSDVQDSNLESLDSQAKKNLEKLKHDIEKANLDYENLLKSNKQTVEGYKKSLKVYYTNITLLFDDVILLGDKLLGVTNQNKYFNDGFETYLGAKNTANKTLAEDSLNNLIRLKDSYIVYDLDTITNDEIQIRLNSLENGFHSLDKFLGQLEGVLKDTVESTALTNTEINSYISSINGFQTSVNTNYGQMNSFQNGVNSFLKVYKDQESSSKKGIDSLNQQLSILETTLKSTSNTAQIGLTKTQLAGESGLLSAKSGLEKTQISSNVALNAYETALKNAKSNYENFIATKDLTLRTLQNSIDQAAIQLQNANKEYDKLFIKAPISGKIAKIFVDKGADVAMGSQLIQVVNSSQPEINVSFSSNEIDYLSLYDKVNFDYDGKQLTGQIISIGNVADSNLNYTVKVGLDSSIAKIGDFVTVYFPIKSSKLILPLNASYIEGNGKGYIFVLSGESFQRLPITYGKAWLDRIEILSPLDSNLEMITSDIKNFDDRKFKIVIKNE